MSSEALVEMTLVALFAGSVLGAARSRLGGAYVLAVLASLARWGMAGLIPAVALADLAQNRRFLPTPVRTGLALAPLALCLAVTRMQPAGPHRGIHYLQVLADEGSFALWQDLHSYWEVILASVSTPPSRKTAGGFLILHQATHGDAGARRRRRQPAPSLGERAPLHEKNLGRCAGVACGVSWDGRDPDCLGLRTGQQRAGPLLQALGARPGVPPGNGVHRPKNGPNRSLPAGARHTRRGSPDRGSAHRAGEPEVRKRIPC